MTKVKRFLGKQTNQYVLLSYLSQLNVIKSGCTLWGNNYENPLYDVVRLQNKVV